MFAMLCQIPGDGSFSSIQYYTWYLRFTNDRTALVVDETFWRRCTITITETVIDIMVIFYQNWWITITETGA